MQNIDLTMIIQAIIGLLAALITYRLIPWLKENTTAKQRMNLCAAANIAVFAAEQIYGADKEQNNIKLNYALSRLREAGFDLEPQVLRMAVESAVKEMKYMSWIEDEPEQPYIPAAEPIADVEQNFES